MAPENESREEIYKKYDEMNRQEQPAPPEGEKAAEKTETVPEETVKQPEKAEEKPEEKKETKPNDPDWKAATYEERLKRKAVNEALEKERKRAAELEAEIKAIRERKPEPPKDDEPIMDYDKALLDIRREVREVKTENEALKSLEQKRAEREQRETVERALQETSSQIEQAHKDLLSEGYYGFKHAVGKVQTELIRLHKEDAGNAALDNPAGWKKIYKEIVFPELKAEQEQADKARSLAEKESLKKSAGLVGHSGNAPKKEKSEDDLTEAEMNDRYFKERRKYGF